jgi:hypothetical protein
MSLLASPTVKIYIGLPRQPIKLGHHITKKALHPAHGLSLIALGFAFVDSSLENFDRHFGQPTLPTIVDPYTTVVTISTREIFVRSTQRYNRSLGFLDSAHTIE